MSRYVAQFAFCRLEFSANLADAGAPIALVVDGEECPTRWQTADARHDPFEAAELMLRDQGRDFFAEPRDSRSTDDIVFDLMTDCEVQ